MNDIIDKLFGQALDRTVPETWTTLDADQLSRLKEKFAELIVKECAAVALREDHDPADCILSHFGLLDTAKPQRPGPLDSSYPDGDGYWK